MMALLALIPNWVKFAAGAALGAFLIASASPITTASMRALSRPLCRRLKPLSKSCAKGKKSMGPYLLLMLPLCAAVSGCQATTKLSACDGFSKLTPNLESSVFILKNDRPFANQVASHNGFGASQGCWK